MPRGEGGRGLKIAGGWLVLAGEGDELVVVTLEIFGVSVERVVAENVVAKFLLAATEFFQAGGVIEVVVNREFEKLNCAGGGVLHAFFISAGLEF